MKSLTNKKLFAIHSWVGIITGILLFVVAFTGAISVFGRPELKIWSTPQLRQQVDIQPQDVAALVEQYAAEVPEAYREHVVVRLPGLRSVNDFIIRFEDHGHNEQEPGPLTARIFTFNPYNLELINTEIGERNQIFEQRDIDMADFLVDFHADLHLGRPVGLLLTGLLGLTLMVSIATGIFIHRKILAQLFTFSPGKTFSRTMNDGHKVMGIWGLLFHSTIGFTGAFLGLALVILVPAAAFVSFQGDQDKLLATFNSMPDPELAHEYQPTKLAEAMTHASQYQADSVVTTLTIQGYGDPNGLVYATLLGGPQTAALTLKYQAPTAEFVEAFGTFGKIEGVTGMILDLMFPLHFGNFGGLLVKTIWAILGLSTAMLPLTGIMLWIERGVSSNNPRHSVATYLWMNRLVVGSCGGLVLACALLFPVQQLLVAFGQPGQFAKGLGGAFFGTWLLLTLMALVLPTRPLLRAMMLTLAIIMLAVTPLDYWLTGLGPWAMWQTDQQIAVGVNLILLLLGSATLYCWYHSRHTQSLLSMPRLTDAAASMSTAP